jgi:hypothetical protein
MTLQSEHQVEFSGKEELIAIQYLDNYFNHIVQMIQKTPTSFEQVTDFGAGIGTLAKRVKPFVNNLNCIEIDPEQVQTLKQQQFTVYESLDALADQSQSFIYSSNVLEHIEDDQAIMHQLVKKLQVNGYLFIYVPAFNCLYSARDKKVGHYRRYDKKRLKRLAQNAGLEIQKLHYVDSLGFLVALLFKLIGDKQGKVNTRTLAIYDRIIFPVSRVFDVILKPWFGKNLLLVAKKPS